MQLDNPIWHALTGPHRKFSLEHGPLRSYQPELAPFSAFQERDEEALQVALALPEVSARPVVLIRSRPEPAPAPWSLAFGGELIQMVCEQGEQLLDPDPRIVPLGVADMPDMLALVALTRPGPFKARTAELGAYFGMRDAEQLIATAGERMQFGGFVEVSAVCTHPDWRGQGLAGRLVSHVAREALSQGRTPFLHVVADNMAARRVYAKLGFVERAVMHLSVWRSPGFERTSSAGPAPRPEEAVG